jgi:hypothetical protein
MRGLRSTTEPPASAPRFYRIRGRLIVPARAVDAMVEAAVAEQGAVDAAGWVRPAAAGGEA